MQADVSALSTGGIVKLQVSHSSMFFKNLPSAVLGQEPVGGSMSLYEHAVWCFSNNLLRVGGPEPV